MDLSDESGNLKYLADHPTTYATEILKARESFVLIRVESKLLTNSCVLYSHVKKVVHDSVRPFSLSRLHRIFKIVVLKINSQVFLFSLLSQYFIVVKFLTPFMTALF